MKKPSPDPQSCASCRHFLANPADEYGYCRRYPPTMSIESGASTVVWPILTASDLCGEYARQLNS
jgi:hypothetical protein